MEIRDNEPVNPRLKERRSGFSRKTEELKKVRPSLCFNCYTSQDLNSCSRCKKIICEECLTKKMCENCYENSRYITNLFCCRSRRIYP